MKMLSFGHSSLEHIDKFRHVVFGTGLGCHCEVGVNDVVHFAESHCVALGAVFIGEIVLDRPAVRNYRF